jgi:hypothetical protein
VETQPASHSPHPGRRGFITGAAAAVTALGTGDILAGQRAWAAPAPADMTAADMTAAAGQAGVTILTPSGDTSGATDTAAINTALTTAQPGDQVWLGAGQWYISQPINMPPMRVLRGMRGAVAAADGSPGHGTNINLASGFTSSFPVSAAIVILDVQSGGWQPLGSGPGSNCGVQIRDLAIVGSAGPPAVDGIASYGPADGVGLSDLSVFATTGYGINCAANPSAIGSRTGPDGWKAGRVLIQNTGNTGWYQVPSDTTAVDMHCQGAGAGSVVAHGFHTIAGGNIRFIGCRADLSTGSGWCIDHPGGGAGGYTDATLLTGCGTQRNQQHGVLVTNSSGTGWRDPVVISGCSFDEDGCGTVQSGSHQGGEYAGICVEGDNRVLISGSAVWVGTVDYGPGCPKYGLMTKAVGSGVPVLVAMTGGHLNYASVAGSMPVSDSAPAQQLLVSSDVSSTSGYLSQSVDCRTGAVNLSGGKATVSSPWVTSVSRIFLSNTHAGGTPGFVYVSARLDGSFTIQSTSASDTSRIAWQLVN